LGFGLQHELLIKRKNFEGTSRAKLYRAANARQECISSLAGWGEFASFPELKL
jgi:hypothetical protein